MKKIYWLLYFISIGLLPTLEAQANLHCPPVATLKTVKFVKAIRNPYDPDCWTFLSAPFEAGNDAWNIDFGTFFPGVQSNTEALKRAQAFYEKADIVIPNPTPVTLPDHTILCDYIPTGRTYWIAALNPPTQSLSTHARQ